MAPPVSRPRPRTKQGPTTIVIERPAQVEGAPPPRYRDESGFQSREDLDRRDAERAAREERLSRGGSTHGIDLSSMDRLLGSSVSPMEPGKRSSPSSDMADQMAHAFESAAKKTLEPAIREAARGRKSGPPIRSEADLLRDLDKYYEGTGEALRDAAAGGAIPSSAYEDLLRSFDRAQKESRSGPRMREGRPPPPDTLIIQARSGDSRSQYGTPMSRPRPRDEYSSEPRRSLTGINPPEPERLYDDDTLYYMKTIDGPDVPAYRAMRQRDSTRI